MGAAPEGAGCRMMRFGRMAAAESHLVRLGWGKLQSRCLLSTSNAASCLEIRRRVGGNPYTQDRHLDDQGRRRVPEGHREDHLPPGRRQEDPGVQGGGSWRFSKGDIDRWIQLQTNEAMREN